MSLSHVAIQGDLHNDTTRCILTVSSITKT